MGSVTETIKDTIDEMAKSGEKVGLVKVLYIVHSQQNTY